MGTNFYLYSGDLASWDEEQALHIGKRSGGSFSLQGHRWHAPEEAIASWADWRSTILAYGFVVSEYGEPVEAERFITDVEASSMQDRGRQHQWMMDHASDLITASMLKDSWLDPEGFSFTWREFF